ncbi:MAG: hypothetical protein H8E66_03310 [Planctomycetes bacterium]|nr:hypothetical protein [Planctomycetota bacterium]
MKRVFVILIGLFLLSSTRLLAQVTDPFAPKKDTPPSDPFGAAKDPFGPFGNTPPPVAPADRKPALNSKTQREDKASRQGTSQATPVFPYVSVGGNSSSRARIERALNGETTFDYLDQPLKDVIEDISYSHNIPIIIDVEALDDFGIDTGTPITKSIKGISLRSALRLTLRELDLTFIIRDEVLQLTTTEVAKMELSTRFYSIGELLPPQKDGKLLTELIMTVVAPDTWSETGGAGSIVYLDHIESLVIRQTDEVFQTIGQLLAATKQMVELHGTKLQPPRSVPTR